MSESRHSPRKVLARQRVEKALQLRVGGATLRQIAAEIGVSRQRVHKILTDELAKSAKRNEPHAAASLALELERLDTMLRIASVAAHNRELSTKERLAAVDRVLSIGDRRAKLLGLNAPEKVAPVTPDGLASYGAPTDEERAVKIVELLARASTGSQPKVN